MEPTKTPGEHWDRDQMERDTEGTPAGEPQGDVWNRHQMEIDDTGTESEAAAGATPRSTRARPRAA